MLLLCALLSLTLICCLLTGQRFKKMITAIIGAAILLCYVLTMLKQLPLFWVVCALLAMLAGYLAYSAISSRNNRLKLLNQQINPYFLYNALDMINRKAINSNMPDICRPIQKLSRFY